MTLTPSLIVSPPPPPPPVSQSLSLSLSLAMFTSALALSLLITVTKATALSNFHNLHPGILNFVRLESYLDQSWWHPAIQPKVIFVLIIWQAVPDRAFSRAGMLAGLERDSSSTTPSMAGWLPGKQTPPQLLSDLDLDKMALNCYQFLKRCIGREAEIICEEDLKCGGFTYRGSRMLDRLIVPRNISQLNLHR